jgi:NarL family two-component system response regulator LiaR
VADNNPALLKAITSFLAVEFDVVATASDGKQVMNLARRLKPDLVVLDLGMPVINGLEATRELAKHSPAIVICSVESDPDIVAAARNAGALGYVFKVRIAKDLVSAVKSAIRGEPFVSPESRI